MAVANIQQLRTLALDSVGEILARPVIRAMLSTDQVNLLHALQTFCATNDDALTKLLAIMNAPQEEGK